MNRRGFMASILAAGFAPAAIGSGVLMPVRKIAAPRGWETLDGSNEEGWILRRQWLSRKDAEAMFQPMEQAYLDAMQYGQGGYTVKVSPEGSIDGFGLSVVRWDEVQREQDAKNRRTWRRLSHAEAEAVIARDVANGCGIITIG